MRQVLQLCLTTLAISTTQITKIEGDQNIVKQIVHHGLSKERFAKLLQPYKENIKDLELRLSKSITIEEKYKLSDQLEKSKKMLQVKEQQVIELNKFIENSNLKVIRNAINIYDNRGLEATLKYLRSKQVKEFEKSVQKNMKELAAKYRLEAKLFLITDRYDEAKGAYENMVVYDRSFESLFEYANFLEKQNYFQLAQKEYETLLFTVLKPRYRATLLNNLGNLYQVQNQHHKALLSYQEALIIYKDLAKSDFDFYQFDIANTLHNLGVYYVSQKEIQKAQEVYQEALVIRRTLAKIKPKFYLFDVADTLNNLAVLYYKQNQFNKAQKAYEEVLNIRQSLVQTNRAHKPYLADTLNNLGLLYTAQNQYQKALVLYKKGVVIYRDLAQKNPYLYQPNVASTLNNMANLYLALNQKDQALEIYQESLKIYRELIVIKPNIYDPDLAMTLNNLAILYAIENKKEKASKAHQEADNIYKALTNTNPMQYEMDVVRSIITGVIYLNQSKETLKEAKAILAKKRYHTNYEAHELLKLIQSILNQ